MPAVTPARTGGAQPRLDPHAQTAFLELGAVPPSARCARAWARQVLREWRLDALAEDAEALIAEMAANAIAAPVPLEQHVISVELAFSHGELAILVSDRDPGLPKAQDPAGEDESGRGLLIVAALSHRHGWYPLKGGSAAKVVWAVLRDPAAPPQPGSPSETPA